MSQTKAELIDGKGDVVFDTNTLAVDATNNRVGIGEAAPGTQVEVNGAEPYITIKNSTEEDTDGGRESKIIFEGEQSGGEISTLAQIEVSHDGAVDDEKGKIVISTNDGNDGAAPTARITVDGDGNVGIGTANPVSALHVHPVAGSTGEVQLTLDTGSGSAAGLDSVINSFRSNADLVFKTNDTDRARIDSSGRVLVGTSSSYGLTTNAVFAGDSSKGIVSIINDGDTFINTNDQLGAVEFGAHESGGTAYIGASIQGTADSVWTGDSPGRLIFSTTANGASSPTERMRINSIGQVFITALDSPAAYTWRQGTSAGNAIQVWQSNIGGASTTRAYFRCDGGLANYSGNNQNLSDEREKKNIESLDSTWECLRNWEIKKFHYNEEADTEQKHYGVIAQQIAEYCPEVITDWIKQNAVDAVLDEEGNVITPAKEEIVRMGVKEQPMTWMAIKALQEAQLRIETLEVSNAALEARLTALEGG